MSAVTGSNAGDVRHAFSVEKLNAYLVADVPALEGPVSVKQFSHGQSNPTYLLENRKGVKFVLRKKPPGQLISTSAHNVEREYRILAALQKYNESPEVNGNPSLTIPVPPVYCLCKDTDVVGSEFYVMEFMKGRIYTDPRLLELPVAERAAYWLELVRVQARLARVDPTKLDLPAGFAPPVDFFVRQVNSMGKLARVQGEVADKETGEKVGLMPGFEQLLEYFKYTKPTGAKMVGVHHGDFKMDNVIFHPTEPRIIALLDWELCTIGPPVMDLMSAISPYLFPPGADGSFGLEGTDPREVGLPTLDEMVETWCKESGTPYPIKYLWWVGAWFFFKGSIISQGIAARYANRQASNPNAQQYGLKRFDLITLARNAIGRDATARVLESVSKL